MQTDWISKLNESQKEAVLYPNQPLLVLAGAGSGKTRVLTTRINHMIESGTPPQEILAVTFTNKAAKEMRSRIHPSCRFLLSIGTFHSICLQILRDNAAFFKYESNFTVYDDQDQLTVIKECCKELNVDEKQLHPKRIRERISRSKDDLILPDQIETVDFEDRLFVPVYKKYEQKLAFYQGFDFGDLILKTVLLFKKSPEILSHYREKFKIILVDEYQDTNLAQYFFVNLIAKKYRQITVVGDPDQSIYEWRGANIENIMTFENDYPDAKVIRLEQNYRSTPVILQAANAVISNNLNRKPKNLWSAEEDGDLISLYRGYDEKDEARYLVSQIQKYQDEGQSLNDMVGFYRTHAQSRAIEEELRRCNIPYQIFGGIKFYARKEIKDVLAYLRVLTNRADSVSLKRILNTPKRGIGLSSVQKMENYQAANDLTFYEAIDQLKDLDLLAVRLKSKLHGFISLIEKLTVLSLEIPLPELFVEVLQRTGYWQMLEQENTLESRSRLENLKELEVSVRDFYDQLAVEEKEKALSLFLEQISLQTDMDDFDQAQDLFTLMTLHSAKGLEYPIVFMLGMEEELLPHLNSLMATNKELEEERRLCYVGITRAQKKLHLSHATSRRIFGNYKSQLPSRFLHEIPSQLFETEYPVSARFSSDDSIDFFDDDDEDVIFYD